MWLRAKTAHFPSSGGVGAEQVLEQKSAMHVSYKIINRKHSILVKNLYLGSKQYLEEGYFSMNAGDEISLSLSFIEDQI